MPHVLYVVTVVVWFVLDLVGVGTAILLARFDDLLDEGLLFDLVRFSQDFISIDKYKYTTILKKLRKKIKKIRGRGISDHYKQADTLSTSMQMSVIMDPRACLNSV